MLRSVNPATGALLAERPEMTAEDLEGALAQVDAGFRRWRRVPVGERAACAARLADLLTAERDACAALMTAEMGKPLVQARAEVEKSAWGCRYYAENAEAFLAPEPVASDATRSYVAHEPLGIVLGVMPWNFPFWQVVRFAVPALVAGNAAVLKHAPTTMGCALALESLFARAGFGEVFRALLIDHEACASVIADPRVRGLTLTGSARAGRQVGELAGRALKKCVLELGGSDPYVILEDADLDVAVPACLTARYLNTGQSCIAGKRFLVVDAVREAFTERLLEGARAQRLGDPMREDTTLGPLARPDLRDAVHDQVLRSVAAGARLLLGGEVPPGPGALYPATVLADVRPGMAAADEEVFGPVAAILPVRDEVDALAVAARTPYGLGAAVFTRDAARGERIAREELEAGSCFVNGLVKSDPRLPFGGVKDSGHGRELGRAGLLEFVNQKAVWVR